MAAGEQPAKRQYVNFSFFKVDPAWRRLAHDERQAGKQEFIRAIEEFSGKIIIVPYSTVGIRGDCDFMLWRITYELELFQEQMSKGVSHRTWEVPDEPVFLPFDDETFGVRGSPRA